MQRSRGIKDKEWCRYIFNVLDNLTIEQRSVLSNEELRHLVSERSIRKFAENISLQDQLIFLGKVGINYAIVTFKEKVDLSPMIRENILDPNTYAEKRLETLKKMQEGQMFVVTNTNVMLNFHIAAMNAHHKAYIFNVNYDRLIKHAKDYLDARTHIDKAEETKKGIEAVSLLSLGAMAILEKSEALFGVSTKYMKILLATFQYRTDFVSRETIIQIIGSNDTPYSISRVCGNMVEKDLLIRHPNRQNSDPYYNHYTISRQGIEVVMKYMRYVVDQLAK